ncbi:MAG: hypothetical protein ACE5Z5_07700 [Candidatus Bathyarchaeia archaeon]
MEDSKTLPIFRPLLTYDISIRPYKDCCSLIARHSPTKARVGTVKKLGKEAEMDLLIE